MIFKIAYAAAVVFSQFIPNEDERFSSHRLYDLIVNSYDIPECIDLVEEIYTLLLQTLIIICKKRTDHQIMITLKSFKFRQDYLEEDEQKLKEEKKLKKKDYDEQEKKKQLKKE